MKIEYVCADCGAPLADGVLTAEDFFKFGEGNMKVEVPVCKNCMEQASAVIRCDGGLIVR